MNPFFYEAIKKKLEEIGKQKMFENYLSDKPLDSEWSEMTGKQILYITKGGQTSAFFQVYLSDKIGIVAHIDGISTDGEVIVIFNSMVNKKWYKGNIEE